MFGRCVTANDEPSMHSYCNPHRTLLWGSALLVGLHPTALPRLPEWLRPAPRATRLRKRCRWAEAWGTSRLDFDWDGMLRLWPPWWWPSVRRKRCALEQEPWMRTPLWRWRRRWRWALAKHWPETAPIGLVQFSPLQTQQQRLCRTG